MQHHTDWQHSHIFNQDQRRPGELRTLMVIAITGVMMVIEIAAGLVFGSMALLADGLHMASHAAALGISAFAYIYARRHARDIHYSFGTGKVNALGGFSSAVLLVVFALIMAWESLLRFFNPVAIAFNQAIFVAIMGLIVNGISVLILGANEEHEHAHEHHEHTHEHHDHNLRAAYFHVLADALTSLMAIFALLTAKYLGLHWMDPLMGIVGAVLVGRWSLGLLRGTSAILLDRQISDVMREKIRQSIEQHDDNRVTDLHVWSVGPNCYAVILSVATHQPKSPAYYKALLPNDLGLDHVTVEVLSEAQME